MILVLTRIGDNSTVSVIQWLRYYRKEFFRLNTLNDIMCLYYDVGGGNAHFENYCGKPICLENIHSYYFNGGNFIAPIPDIKHKELQLQTSRYLQQEATALLSSLVLSMRGKKTFGLFPFDERKVNKLYTLHMAKTEGLLIPESAIVSTKVQLMKCKLEWGKIINKSIDDGICVNTEHIMISGQRTVEVSDDEIEGMGETFFPSLIQKLIPKKYEIRVFYFKSKFYSIAIFSQRNEESKIDSRTVNINNPNREVPYLLSNDLKRKISTLMKKLQLNYGSIDLIYATDNNYYFLEVNPYGQYGFLSSAGNYYLEKQIAEYL